MREWVFIACGYRATIGAFEEERPRRGPGRPRKWESDAERARAYRERRAGELADVEHLRRDRRRLQRTVRTLTVRLEGAERRAEVASQRLAKLQEQLARSEAEVRRLGAVVERLNEERRSRREAATENPQVPRVGPESVRSLNRAQRRRLGRQKPS